MAKENNKKLIIWATIALVIGIVIGLLITNLVTTGNANSVTIKKKTLANIKTISCSCKSFNGSPGITCSNLNYDGTQSAVAFCGYNCCSLQSLVDTWDIK